jgi:hypothetical protein
MFSRNLQNNVPPLDRYDGTSRKITDDDPMTSDRPRSCGAESQSFESFIVIQVLLSTRRDLSVTKRVFLLLLVSGSSGWARYATYIPCIA